MFQKKRVMRGIFLTLFFCFFWGATFFPVAVKAEENRTEGAKKAFSPSLKIEASAPEWLALGHYQPAFFGGYKSTLDTPGFFLAPDGRTNPVSELDATRALLRDKQGDTIKKCLFPARYLLLQKAGESLAPYPACPDFESFRTDLNPAALTLLYTDAYMNNPSSLFGHTLLRIDIPEGRTQLVAHGVNYGAFVDPNENGVLFAVLGLTGGYLGGFSVKPYYDIINTYNNIENRDIWEMTLALSDEELAFFVAHLWELGHNQSRYFFFSENCSYMLMEVLDAVRPSLHMAAAFRGTVIPADTLKAVAAQTNLVKRTHYRPSRQKRIAVKYEAMPARVQKRLSHYLADITGTDLSDLSPLEQAMLYDVAYEYLQYQAVAGEIDLPLYRKKTFHTLKKRRDLPVLSGKEVPEPVSPLLSHASKRLVLSQGWLRGEAFQELDMRWAYHSLTDAPAGLLRGSEINFGRTTLRYYAPKNRLVLESFEVVDIVSISPRNALFHPYSYHIKASLTRLWNPKNDKEGYVAEVKGGTGVAYELFGKKALYGYAFLNTRGAGGGFLAHNMGLSMGPAVGLLWYGKHAQAHLSAERLFSDNWQMDQTLLSGEITYQLGQNWAVAAGYQWDKIKPHSDNTVRLGLRHYF